jgi:hypothetical protein
VVLRENYIIYCLVLYMTLAKRGHNHHHVLVSGLSSSELERTVRNPSA